MGIIKIPNTLSIEFLFYLPKYNQLLISRTFQKGAKRETQEKKPI